MIRKYWLFLIKLSWIFVEILRFIYFYFVIVYILYLPIIIIKIKLFFNYWFDKMFVRGGVPRVGFPYPKTALEHIKCKRKFFVIKRYRFLPNQCTKHSQHQGRNHMRAVKFLTWRPRNLLVFSKILLFLIIWWLFKPPTLWGPD